MTEQPNKPSLASIEADVFGMLFAFQKKTMTLVRESSLDDEKLKVVAHRIKTLLDAATAEVKQTNEWKKIKERLETAYDEVKQLMDELSA